MDYVSIILPFIGGLGMFIYGMQIMARDWRMQQAAR